jgi:hypothetical protein
MRQLKRVIPLLLPLILASCLSSQTRTIALTDDEINRLVCSQFQVMSYDSELDSVETQNQVIEYNARVKAFCGK